jgi:hypothetical protein|tara:strand:- start:483 stop:875 length:393 start_codon:yes stop_codon:yes gene_type:complete
MDLKKIYEKYSDIILDEYVFVDIGDGWSQIVEELLAATKVYQDINIGTTDFTPVIFTTIAARHGWLNVEFDGGDEVVAEIANFSRILSFKTCELCGTIGKLYCSEKWMHWSDKKTLCTSHAVKLFYYRIT